MIKRKLLKKVEEMSKHFPVIMITGARQVGKTTLLKEFQNLNSDISYVTLDYPNSRELAQNDPESFLARYKTPLIIDEIQYAPELLTYIKIKVDTVKNTGMYYLTGSQMFHAMKNLSESLAGRAGILNMYSLSLNEIRGVDSKPFLPNLNASFNSKSNVKLAFQEILKGGMPKLFDDQSLNLEDYFGSYVQTYIERDIRDLINIRKETQFIKFMRTVAARTSSELNLSDIAKDVNIDQKTAQNWFSLLVSSGIVAVIQPYFKNTIKKIVKRPKFYFMDTGLCCNLSMWNNAQALELSAMSGAMFETYVVSEIIKSYVNNGIDYRNRLFYYRENHGKELDLLIYENGKVYPIEIKKNSNPNKTHIKNFTALKNIKEEIGDGAVICTCRESLPIDDNVVAMPYDCI